MAKAANKNYLSIVRVKSLTGFPVRDGSRVKHISWEEIAHGGPTAGMSIERRDRHHSSPLHNEMKNQGMAYFRSKHFRVFPRQIGLWGHNNIWRFSDFAVEKKRNIQLVECLTPWGVDADKIKKKLQLDCVAPVIFISALSKANEFKAFGFGVGYSFGRFEETEMILFQR